MLVFKFDDDFLDDLFEIVENEKFKEKDSLNYLITNRELLLIIPVIFDKYYLTTELLETTKKWQNYIDNEFKNWVLKNNINKIKIETGDKPDLIVTIKDKSIGIELTSVFPFHKDKKRGDIFKHYEDSQTKIKDNLFNKLRSLNLEEKMPKIKIIEKEVVFPKEFTNSKDKKIIEQAITQVKNIDQIAPIIFIPRFNKEKLSGYELSYPIIGKNPKNELNINNLESNLINTIKDKNEKLEKHYKLKVENNVLLIIVEEIFHFINWFVSPSDNGLDDDYHCEVKGGGCINYYLNSVYSKIDKEKNKFDQTIVIYKNADFIKHIYIKED